MFGPTTVNEFRVQYEYYLHDDIAPDICGKYPFTSCLLGRLVFPSVSVGINNTYPDWYNVEHKWQFKDDFSKQIGSHAFGRRVEGDDDSDRHRLEHIVQLEPPPTPPFPLTFSRHGAAISTM